MNKDEELNPYQPDATDGQKALELTQKDQGFKNHIQTLKDNQEKLDGKYESLGSELRGKTDDEIAKDQNGFQKLRKDYDQAGIAADENREALKQKKEEYEKFKEENKGNGNGIGQDVDSISKPLISDAKKINHKGLDKVQPNAETRAKIESIDRGGGNNYGNTSDKAQQASRQTQQRDNAFTQLEDSDQSPAPAQALDNER